MPESPVRLSAADVSGLGELQSLVGMRFALAACERSSVPNAMPYAKLTFPTERPHVHLFLAILAVLDAAFFRAAVPAKALTEPPA
jgi:hypothetical protein